MDAGEWSPPPGKKRGRKPKAEGAPVTPRKPRRHKMLTQEQHVDYVVNQERQRHAPLRSGRKPKRVNKAEHKYSRFLIGDALLDRIARGELLKEVLKESGMPPFNLVQKWRRDNVYDFGDRFRIAVESQTEAMADDVIIIADSKDHDPRDKRIMYDARRYVMAHRRPEVWGERVTVSGDANNPLFRMDVKMELASLSDSELAALEAFTLARQEALEKPQTALDVPFTDVTDESEVDR